MAQTFASSVYAGMDPRYAIDELFIKSSRNGICFISLKGYSPWWAVELDRHYEIDSVIFQSCKYQAHASSTRLLFYHAWADPDGKGAGGLGPLENHKLLYVSLWNTGTGPSEKQLDPMHVWIQRGGGAEGPDPPPPWKITKI